MRDDLGGLIALQQQLAASLELTERQVLPAPLRYHLFQLCLDVFLFVRRYADVLQCVVKHYPVF